MNPTRRARPILLAFVMLLGVFGSASVADAAADAGTPAADQASDQATDPTEGQGLMVPADDGLALSDQQFDDLDMDLVEAMRDQPEVLHAPAGARSAVATSRVAGQRCHPTCEGRDPVREGCDDGATIREYVETVRETRFLVQLRFSGDCGSIWSRARFIDGNSGRLMALETREYLRETTSKLDPVETSNNVLVSGFSDGWVWTTMLTAPSRPNVRACSQPSIDTGRDDFLQCSRPGYTSLISARGLCLDVPFRNFSRGQRVWIYGCHGAANLAQMWQIRPDGTIRTGGLDGNTLCLRIDRAQAGNGIPLVLWDCRGWASQQWRYQPSGQIINNSNGRRCVDVPNGVADQRTFVQVWECVIWTSNNRPIGAQLWRSPSTAYLDGLN
ncbi:MAG: RICIN domain-containing protein [Actinomycetota bacterium]